MKKLLLSSMVFFSVLATAQTQKTQMPASPGKQLSHNKQISYSSNRQQALSKTANTTGSEWFNVLDFNELLSPGLQTFSAMHLFPDSNIILGFATGNVPVYAWIHKAGNYMDPSFMAQQNIITDKFATYTLDSVSVGYSYTRGSANSITDSLIIQVIAENHALDYTVNNEFAYQDITYNQATNNTGTGITVLKRIAYPLTVADSTSFWGTIKVATPGIAPQTNSKKIGTVVSFKPGYTYTAADTLLDSHRTNAFFIISAEQNGDGGGAGTDPTIYSTPGDYTSDMNMSYIIPQDIRYNQNANGWNGYFIPTYAYTTPFAYENHDIGYKLSVSITGVKDLENKGFTMTQNMPNPYSTSSTVDFQLAKDANSALFTLTDIAGRVVMTQNVETTKGIHSVKLGAYAPGVYYYSLNVDGNIITKKMIVE